MLNGKFYTGLTENQLNRSAGPNRQKTNFFWPDEKDVPVNSAPYRSTRSAPREVIQKNSQSEDTSPAKELFKKQLSSKIQFYDIIDAKKTPPSVRKQNVKRDLNRNFYEKNNIHINDAPKPKTFESKIEFYDFVEADKPKPNTSTTKMNATKNVQDKKRISFQDADDWDLTKKGILKNNDDGVRVEHTVPIDLNGHRTNNRNYGSKLQPSKSVDNLAKLKMEIKDDFNERNDKANGVTSQLNRLDMNNKQKINISKRSEPRMDDFGYNSHGYNDYSKYYIQPSMKRNDRQTKSYSQRNSNHGWNNEDFESIEETLISNNYEDNRYARRNSDQHQRSNLRKPHVQTKNNTFNDRLPVNPIDETDEYHQEIIEKIAPITENTKQKQRVITVQRSSTINGSNDYPNEARRRAHTHLRSNICFQDDDRSQQRRPLSIRESAVQRVGVGLPNL